MKTKKLLNQMNYAAKVVASGCCCNCNSCCCCWSLFSSSATMEQATLASNSQMSVARFESATL